MKSFTLIAILLLCLGANADEYQDKALEILVKTVEKALAGLEEILSRPVNTLADDIRKRIFQEVPGILEKTKR